MRDSCRQHSRYGIATLLFALIIASLASCAAPAGLGPRSQVLLFASSDGQWVPTTFAQAKPGSEFVLDSRLYRVAESGKAEVVPNIDIGRLVEADLPYDRTSRRPTAGDVVQVLDKDMRFVEHALLGSVQPGATVRFQGRSYSVAADRGLVDTGKTFSGALQRIEITNGALRHITDRHTPGGAMNAGKSTFNAGEDIQTLIRNSQLLAPVPQERGNSERVFDGGRIIGTDRATGRQTSTYTVITTQSGKLVTAFPGLP